MFEQLLGGGGGRPSSQLGGLPVMAVVSVPNHYAPMLGETFGGSMHDPELEKESMGHFGLGPAHERMDAQREDYRSDDVYQAALLALEAHEYLPHEPEQAARRARRALQVSPLCPEAHNVLALLSGSYEEALQHYRRGEEVGLQVVPPERLQQELDTDEAWMRCVLRPYLRALFGVGNTLRKLGRCALALEKYERLCKLSSHLKIVGWKPNWHAHLPELWLRVYGPQQCLARAARHPQREGCVEYRSCELWWMFNIGLAQFATGMVRDYRGFDADREDTDEPGDVWRLANRGHALLLAVHHHEKVCQYLLGERALPSNPIPDMMGGGETYTQAALYAKLCGDLWRAVPGALDFLRKMHHTQRYAVMLTNTAKRPPQFEFDPEAALRHVEAGVFPNVVTTPTPGPDITFMHGTASLGAWRPGMQAYQARLMKALLKSNGNPSLRDSQGLTPLHQASYYAAGAETIKLLVEAGADPLLSSGWHPSPLEMTANQGNADEMDAFLTLCPDLCSVIVETEHPITGKLWRGTMLNSLLRHCLQSSCLPCLAGGPKCQRCEKDCPHHATASFHRCVEVLVKHGLRCTPKVMESTKEPVEDMPHALRPPLRDVIQHFVEASLAADASARSGEVPGGAAAAAAAAGPSGATPASSSASQAPPPRRCAHCGTAEGKLLKCRGCRVAYFCSDDCQKANWPAHKAACKQAQRQRVAAEGGGTQDAPAGSA